MHIIFYFVVSFICYNLIVLIQFNKYIISNIWYNIYYDKYFLILYLHSSLRLEQDSNLWTLRGRLTVCCRWPLDYPSIGGLFYYDICYIS